MISFVRFFFLFLSLFCIGITLPPPSPAFGSENRVGNLTLFIYHKFGEESYPTTNVGLDRFDQQLAFLRDNNITVLSLAAAVSLLQKGEPFPGKTAVITIDDGYKSTYTGAWPLLKKYGFPFTVFLYCEAIEKKYSNFLTWDQIQEMAAAGVDFQDHGYRHLRLAGRPVGMDDVDYKAWVVDDLTRSRRVFAAHGLTPRFLAYPYGEYNTVVKEVARSLGYDAAFSQDPGSASQFTDLFSIPREPILGYEWSGMDHFAKVLDRVDLPVSDVTPDVRPFTETTPAKFCATLRYPELYLPGTIGLYVSELGWQPALSSGGAMCVSNSRKLNRRSNRVAISGREKESGRSAIHYWLLVDPAAAE